MNEIELIRTFRAHAARPDADQARRARSSLMAVIAEESRESGGTSPKARSLSKMPRRRILAVALAGALLPGGYAIAQAVSGSGEVRDEAGNPVPGISCPEADAAFERAGVPAPDVYGHCPGSAELEATIQQLRTDVDRLRSIKID